MRRPCTIDTVVGARRAVGFGAEIGRCLHRHAAALAEFHFVGHHLRVLGLPGRGEPGFEQA